MLRLPDGDAVLFGPETRGLPAGLRDIETFKAFFHAMLQRGVYLAPSAFEAGFVSAAHDESIIAATLATGSSRRV